MKLRNCLFILIVIYTFVSGCYTKNNNEQQIPTKSATIQKVRVGKPEYVRGIHLSAWTAGDIKFRARFENLLSRDKLNTIVIAIKESEGHIYIPSVKIVEEYNIPVFPIPKLEQYLDYLKSKGVYPIARIVVFKDNSLAHRKPEFAVKNPDGSLWKDYKGYSWTDPYNKNVWRYNVEIAKRAVELGFEEIQFDYIRFPSDGNTKLCRYSQKHSSITATETLVNFLTYAKEELKPFNIPVSIDVFGLTPSVNHDMGIGQRFLELSEACDFISPMMYPSHYRKGEYNIPDPNKEPYKTVYRSVYDAKLLLKDKIYKLRPYLQDFSLGYKYGVEEVKAQIYACYDNGVFEWLLWDPKCKYTLEAIEEMIKYTPQNYKPFIKKSTITYQTNDSHLQNISSSTLNQH